MKKSTGLIEACTISPAIPVVQRTRNPLGKVLGREQGGDLEWGQDDLGPNAPRKVKSRHYLFINDNLWGRIQILARIGINTRRDILTTNAPRKATLCHHLIINENL